MVHDALPNCAFCKCYVVIVAHPLRAKRVSLYNYITLTKGACVDVCPVDCIYTTDDDNQYYINPDECIDCAACEPVCPVTAIFAEEDTPDEWENFKDINYEYFGLSR